mmetsp:Transcript_34715/g.59516  ORF Transcript_34715/g.59516 Transcript_34715/m.59516 type:complete len:290 (-) Transcript_34715:280-1149(-)
MRMNAGSGFSLENARTGLARQTCHTSQASTHTLSRPMVGGVFLLVVLHSAAALNVATTPIVNIDAGASAQHPLIAAMASINSTLADALGDEAVAELYSGLAKLKRDRINEVVEIIKNMPWSKIKESPDSSLRVMGAIVAKLENVLYAPDAKGFRSGAKVTELAEELTGHVDFLTDFTLKHHLLDRALKSSSQRVRQVLSMAQQLDPEVVLKGLAVSKGTMNDMADDISAKLMAAQAQQAKMKPQGGVFSRLPSWFGSSSSSAPPPDGPSPPPATKIGHSRFGNGMAARM